MTNTPENKITSTMPLWVKIFAPILVIVVICGMFIIKNMQDKPSDENETYPLKISAVNLQEIKAYGVPTVIDFGSDSCIPCKEMAPVLETLNAEWQGKAVVQFMDVWKYTDGVQNFPVQVIPTQVFFTAEGKPFEPSDELASKIQFNMYSDRNSGEHIFTVHQGGITEEEMRLIFAEMGVE